MESAPICPYGQAPGHRVPNIVVSANRTLFDRFGPDFTLVGATSGLSDAKQLLDVAELTGLPIRHVVLDDPRLCERQPSNHLNTTTH